MELYKKPVILSRTNISGIVPLAAVGAAVVAAAESVSLTEAVVGAATVLGFMKGLGDDYDHPELARTLTARKNFVL